MGAKVLGMNGVFLRMTSPRWVTEETSIVDPDLYTGKSHQGNVLELLGTRQSPEGVLIGIAEPSGVARGFRWVSSGKAYTVAVAGARFPSRYRNWLHLVRVSSYKF